MIEAELAAEKAIDATERSEIAESSADIDGEHGVFDVFCVGCDSP